MTKEEKLARKQQRKAEKVGLGKLLLWNSSSCSVALSTLMLGYATFYCTDVLQLAPALVGTLFMVSKIFDSFTDIVAGFIVDRTQTRWGKGRPYEIFMLFLWLSTWLLFSCPTSFATAAKCIWIFCMYTFMNSICVTFLNANNVVYMVRAFENKEQQSKIVGYGSIFTMAGAMVFNVLFPTAMAKVGTDAVGWSRLVGMIAIPLTAIGMLRILTIPEKFTPVSEKNGEQTHLKDLLPLLKESRPVLIICMKSVSPKDGVGVMAYTLSKRAMNYYTSLKAVEFGKRGIRVNALLPGSTDTGMKKEFEKMAGGQDNLVKENGGAGRLATPQEMADPLLFLNSDMAAFVSGLLLIADMGHNCEKTLGFCKNQLDVPAALKLYNTKFFQNKLKTNQ